MLNFYGSFIKLMCNISALIFWVQVDFGYELTLGTSWFGYELTWVQVGIGYELT